MASKTKPFSTEFQKDPFQVSTKTTTAFLFICNPGDVIARYAL